MKPTGTVKIKWSPEFAYALGLLTTDGSLSADKRHIIFTSQDLQLIHAFQKSLHIHLRIGKKASGLQAVKKYYVVQIGDVQFYKFLENIGLTRNKTKTIGQINIPPRYFFDFLRGHFDGDGTFYSYWDKRWKSSYMFYTVFASSSGRHIIWLQRTLKKLLGIRGHITTSTKDSVYELRFAKKESLQLLPHLYYHSSVPCLARKRSKIRRALWVVDKALP